MIDNCPLFVGLENEMREASRYVEFVANHAHLVSPTEVHGEKNDHGRGAST